MKMSCVIAILCVYAEWEQSHLELFDSWVEQLLVIFFPPSSVLPLTKEAEKRMARKGW